MNLENLTDEQLKIYMALLRLELNAAYGKFPTQEKKRSDKIWAEIMAIRAEQKRREKNAMVK